MIEKDAFITGILLGAVVPVLGFVAFSSIIEGAISLGWMNPMSGMRADKMYRTLLLLAICSILIPFHIAKHYRWDETMRGLLLPTMIYVAGWVYKFYDQLMAY